MTEVPIRFVDREMGTSKMSSRIVVEALWLVTAWGVMRLFRRARSWLSGAPAPRVGADRS